MRRPPVNATVHKVTGEVVPHENGLYFDVDSIVEKVLKASAKTRLALEPIEVVPLAYRAPCGINPPFGGLLHAPDGES